MPAATLHHQQQRFEIGPSLVAPVGPGPGKRPLDSLLDLEGSDKLGEHNEPAPRRDHLVGPLKLERKDGLM